MPLSGIRVLDLTRLLPGAFCTMLLADMGADVIKVEAPDGGDYMRWMPPLVDGQSVLFNALNRNKRSLALNLKAEPGRDLLLRLADRFHRWSIVPRHGGQQNRYGKDRSHHHSGVDEQSNCGIPR